MPELTGPSGPIAYRRDRWGTPRFEVRDLDEAAFARGFFHAVDRGVQVQLTLAVGRGELMSLLGDAPLPRWVDHSTRTLGLARGLDAQVAALEPAMARMIDAYCDGFNAGMKARGRPLATRLLGLVPQPFAPRDVVLIYRVASWFGISSLTIGGRVLAAQLVASGADDALLDLLFGPDAEGVDREAVAGLTWPEDQRLPGFAPPRGSNAFAVAASRSSSGGALLMGEFHMEVCRLPGVVHITHAQLPDGYLQGVSIPGLPLVSAGRTRDLAWSFTFGHADQIDITVQRCRGGARLHGADWVPLTPRTETMQIKGGTAETRTLWDFPGGTVLSDPSSPDEVRRFGLGWRGLDETHRDLSAQLPLLKATSVDEATEHMRALATISVAGVFADSAGRIGWVHSGRVARDRSGWGPRTGWDRVDDPDIPEDERPLTLDPAEGFLASANERCTGWTSFPEARYRHERISALLSGSEQLTADDLLRISYDEHDGCAARLLPVWRPHLPDGAQGQALAAWDGSGGHRTEQALFHALHHELLHHIVSEHVGADASRALWEELDLIIQLQDRLDDTLALETEHLDADALGEAIRAVWPAALARAERDAVTGPVTAGHKNIITQGKLPGFLGFSTPAVPLPGGPCSAFAMRRNFLMGEEVLSGPAFHVLIDMAEDGLRYNIAGGASERRFGPGYAAGVDAWRSGELEHLV